MSVGLPKISITFKQLVDTFVERSQRGVGFLIVKDDTAGASINEVTKENFKELKTQYTAENQNYIEDAIGANIFKLFVMKLKKDEELNDVLDSIKTTYSSGRVTMVGTAEEYAKIVTWVKAQAENDCEYHGLVFKKSESDSKYVESFESEKVTFADDRGEVTGEKFLPTLLGILCKCNVERSATYYVCDTLSTVQEVASPDKTINAGGMVLINDWHNGVNSVRIGAGVNTLKTFTEENPEDLRYIDMVEAQDLIKDDIRTTFKNDYIGKEKNKTDNQMLFVGYVREFLTLLAEQDILDPDWNNTADIDVQAQREAWSKMKKEAKEWDDAKVRRTPYKRDVFLTGDIKICGAIENLTFNIAMN